MNPPTHDSIAQRAHQLWEDFGHPEDRDVETWLIAERQLITAGKTPEPKLSGAAYAEHAAAKHHAEGHAPPTIESKASLQAEAQKLKARAPQVAHHTGPKPQPAPSGKPLWSKPHSS
jgi:hypothetical protein